MTYAEKHWGDCSKAVAYALNFVQMCYMSSSACMGDFYASKCPHRGDWSIQIKDFVYPKSGFSKKDYYFLDTNDYGVSEKLMNDFIKFGVERENFRPIRYSMDNNIILGYSVCPINTLPKIYHLNSAIKKERCLECQLYSYEMTDDSMCLEAYNGLAYPIYISEQALSKIGYISKTVEFDEVIISLELYNYLIKKYPRLECRPVFLGNVRTDDREFLRLH
ncbi:MAG: hypothetical protein IJL87_03555 [Clostridia bacterium]|nr:hypothetical protein [Clostridia bacterium]